MKHLSKNIAQANVAGFQADVQHVSENMKNCLILRSLVMYHVFVNAVSLCNICILIFNITFGRKKIEQTF